MITSSQPLGLESPALSGDVRNRVIQEVKCISLVSPSAGDHDQLATELGNSTVVVERFHHQQLGDRTAQAQVSNCIGDKSLMILLQSLVIP